MANRIVLNQISYHGKGAIEEIANEAKARRLTKAFVCTDPDLVKFGVTQKVLTVLEKNGLAYELYSNVKPNPTIENVQTGVKAFRPPARTTSFPWAAARPWTRARPSASS